MIGEPCDEADDVTPDDADHRAAACDDDEGGEPFEDVGHLQVLFAQVQVGVEHVVQDLKTTKKDSVFFSHFWMDIKLETRTKNRQSSVSQLIRHRVS